MFLRKKIILLSLIVGNLVEQPTPEIHIDQGILRGRVSVDGKIFEYLGIPYATANETNRFREPLPPPTWDGVFDAMDEHHRCPQIFVGKLSIGQEDCLKINVYSPSSASASNTPLPVMVFIHGGGFVENSATPFIYGPEFFVRHGVVLVTFNYRIGALGFLCLGTEGAPGNAGLRDQLAALHWIKRNIRSFGGDPDNVTLFGESAGAASVSFLKLSPLSKDLYKRTILQSGSSLGSWTLQSDPIGTASRFAKAMGFDSSDPEKLLSIFKEATIQQLVAIDVPKLNNTFVTGRLLFVPCIENNITGVNKIISEHPYEILKSGRYNTLPTISGFNDKEGMFSMAKENVKSLQEKNKATFLPSNLDFDTDIARIHTVKKIRKFYFGESDVSAETKSKLLDWYSDVFFIMPSIFEADLISKTSRQPQYNYFFKYSGHRNVVKYISGFTKEAGASHADDLFYMFKSNIYPFIFGNDQTVIDRFTTMWTNFAKYGNPTPSTSALLPQLWTPSEPNNLKFLYIDDDLYMGPVPNKERITFWNETYTQYRRKS